MYNFPVWLAHRLGVLNKTRKMIYCSRCKDRNYGKGVFLGYFSGGFLMVPISKGRDRVRWQVIKEGGICCDNGHYTALHEGDLKTVNSEARDATTG